MTRYPSEIALRFDPLNTGCANTSAVFLDATARTLYLLWRFNHIVGPDFARDVLIVAARINQELPVRGDDLMECFRDVSLARDYDCDFPPNDVRNFCADSLPYFTGGKTIGYRVVPA